MSNTHNEIGLLNANGSVTPYGSTGSGGGGGGDTVSVKATYDESPALYAHAVDDLIYFDSHFYKVTSAIAVNDAIASGTNITAANLTADTVVYVDKLPGGV